MWTYNYSQSSDELYHHGVKGMKWGVRRYRNKDGSLTSAGKKRQAMLDAKLNKETAKLNKRNASKNWDRAYRDMMKATFNSEKRKARDKVFEKADADYQSARKAHKQSKKVYRQAKKEFEEQKTIDKFKKHGLDYNSYTAVNVYNYGWKSAKRIEDRVKNKQMSRIKAETIENGRALLEGAALTIGTVGVLAIAGAAANKLANPKMQILDANGKVIRNIYR